VTRPRLALLWHLHQPLYAPREGAPPLLPWVRLHALRGYYDTVRVLDEFPAARLTVNLTPILVEQIAAAAAGRGDRFLEVGALPAEELDETQRRFLVDRFFLAQELHMIRPLRGYGALLEKRAAARRLRGPRDAFREFATGELRDLQVLFDLSWFGFKTREDFPILRALARKGCGFTPLDLEELHGVEREVLKRILPLYRAAARRGQLEIATSPYAHPILPLLLDTEAAREAMPQAVLPSRLQAPDDARAQVEDGLALIEREIGVRPRGLWPSEGALSEAEARLLHDCGVSWAAGDDRVLAASGRGPLPGGAAPGPLPAGDLQSGPPAPGAWRLASSPDGPDLVFRDHELSDRISFAYSHRDPAAAVADLIEGARQRMRDGAPFVLLALDGENPWEHYRRAGASFLRTLYGEAGPDGTCELVTVSESVAAAPARGTLTRLRAGSWINADFSTWIGGPEKNRAWGLLAEVRSRIASAPQRVGAAHHPSRAAAWAALRAAEGSDWFWWLDGQFDTPDRATFDTLFRGHLRRACEAAGVAPPGELERPIPAPERLAEPDGAAS
jgi:alpha-amylase/alpha-mannosidase (GH57 family)